MLLDPLRVQVLLFFFASVILAQVFLVLKKKQFEKGPRRTNARAAATGAGTLATSPLQARDYDFFPTCFRLGFEILVTASGLNPCIPLSYFPQFIRSAIWLYFSFRSM